MQALDTLFIMRQNVYCTRHILLTSKLTEDKNICSFVSRLKQLTKDCEFKSVTIEQHRNEMLLIALVNGFKSDSIRQWILETIDVLFDQAHATTESLELAFDNNCKYYSYRGSD